MTSVEARDGVCVYCASSDGMRSDYGEAAARVGALLAQHGRTLVYGGGLVGLMGRCARACLDGGGRVVGVLPRFMSGRELPNDDASELIMVDTMHERKRILSDRSAVVMVLPGGAGTLDEFFEALTWNQLGLTRKPVGLLSVNGYFGPLLDLLEQAVVEGFMPESSRDALIVDEDPEALLKKLLQADAEAPRS